MRYASTFKRRGRFKTGLSDLVAPRTARGPDYIGAFTVTAGDRYEDVVAERFKRPMTLFCHHGQRVGGPVGGSLCRNACTMRVRQEFWGYEPEEKLSSDEMDYEQYRGIRPRALATSGAAR